MPIGMQPKDIYEGLGLRSLELGAFEMTCHRYQWQPSGLPSQGARLSLGDPGRKFLGTPWPEALEGIFVCSGAFLGDTSGHRLWKVFSVKNN